MKTHYWQRDDKIKEWVSLCGLRRPFKSELKNGGIPNYGVAFVADLEGCKKCQDLY